MPPSAALKAVPAGYGTSPAEPLGAQQRRQQVLDVTGFTRGGEAPGGVVDVDQAEGERHAAARQLLGHAQLGEEAHAQPAVDDRHLDTRQAERRRRAQRLEGHAALTLPARSVGHHDLAREAPGGLDQPVFLGRERRRHHSPGRPRSGRPSTQAKNANATAKPTASAPKVTENAVATAARAASGSSAVVRSSRLDTWPVLGSAPATSPSTSAEAAAMMMAAPSERENASAPLTVPRSRRSTAFCTATVLPGKVGPMPIPTSISSSEALQGDRRWASRANSTKPAIATGTPSRIGSL